MRNQPTRVECSLLYEVNAKCSQLSIPIHMTLELTYRCNLRCSHCYVDITESDELSFEEWKGVLGQFKDAGTVYLLFTGGEVTVRPDFLDIATYARRNGFILSVLTNCTLVTPTTSRAIAELKPFLIGTSLYGATASSHEAVTGVSGSFQRTVEGIRLFVEAGLVPLVQATVMKSNVAELRQITELIESLGAQAHMNFEISPSKTGANFPFQCEPGIDDLLAHGLRPDALGPCEEKVGLLCTAGKACGSISPSGDVFPCLALPLKLGSLRQSSFDSIWRLEPCVELRYLRSMRRSDLYACNACELNTYCHRCTGDAYLESGRIDGPSSSACRRAQMRVRLTQAEEVPS